MLIDTRKRINELLKDDHTVYVIKGFPGLDFEGLQFPYLTDLNVFETIANDTELSQFRKSFIPELLSKLLSDSSYVLSFEQYALLGSNVTSLFSVYGYKTVILLNNLYRLYFPAEGIFNDDMKSWLEEESATYHAIQECYSEFNVIDGITFVQYADPGNETLDKTIEIFEHDDNDQIQTVEVQGTADFYIDKTDENLAPIVYRITNGEKIRLIIEAQGKPSLTAITILEELHHLGYQIILQRKRLEVSTVDYSSYLEILHRRNSSWSFKEFDVYQNPGYSLDTVKVSQGVIIDSIIKNALAANKDQSFYDIFVTAPTGAGKSLLFQIPAIYLAEKKN